MPLARIAAGAALVIVIVALGVLLFGGGGGYEYNLLFQNGGQLVNGNQVLIGGSPVGKVNSIELTDDNLAEVHITVEQQLHEGTTAVIRDSSLSAVANHYVSISPGPNSNPALDDGATLGLGSTTTSADLDQLFNTFTPPVRKALSEFIQGNGAIYAGRGKQANATYKYFGPGLNRTSAFFGQLTADQRQLRRFVVGSSKLFTALAARNDELSDSIGHANKAFGAIASQNVAFDQSLRRLPPTFRQANTTFVNLRAALDDLDPLVSTAKKSTRNLAPFLRRLRPVVEKATPLFRNLRLSVNRPGKANDLAFVLAQLPKLQDRASTAFPAASKAISDYQPTLNMARAYTPDILNALTKLGQVTSYYDAIGHYVRAQPVFNLFKYDSSSQALEPIPPSENMSPFGATHIPARCPGGATQSAPDNSNPFVDPPWAGSVSSSDCSRDDAPPGP